MAPLIIYGATGYSGRLASEYAKSLDLNFSIAGRTEHKLKSLASLLDVSYSVFDINQVDLTDSVLKEASVLLNCAGPFAHTSKPLIEACIRNKVHYLDIAAELDSYQHAQRLDKDARGANVTLMPGCGGSVVMLGCLASHVVEQIETPIKIDIAMRIAGSISRGSATSAAESITSQCLQLVDGSLVGQDISNTAEFDFDDGNGYVTSFPVTLPDLLTIQKSTNVLNIATYVNISSANFPTGDLALLPEGPTAAERKTTPYHAAVSVTSEHGVTQRAALHIVNGYTFTSMASVQAAKQVMDHQTESGFQTPVEVFGKDFVLAIPGSKIIDLHSSTE
ncbi:putative saccharopine dehydrogenase protein [Botrytis fragariae]|uniref:Putative saccharopine dehydrogenase protein n=1 Tax=Botrytis fragariae TaxID=1964551 RepID=A0A8H6AJ92_9HELO|nr:putative saccharopine dehydrogenase protein [Botrytis fragariae]KAF5868258.1 putative saccharopine dehydrogenase protein [Botrytis fragariae]